MLDPLPNVQHRGSWSWIGLKCIYQTASSDASFVVAVRKARWNGQEDGGFDLVELMVRK